MGRWIDGVRIRCECCFRRPRGRRRKDRCDEWSLFEEIKLLKNMRLVFVFMMLQWGVSSSFSSW